MNHIHLYLNLVGGSIESKSKLQSKYHKDHTENLSQSTYTQTTVQRARSRGHVGS